LEGSIERGQTKDLSLRLKEGKRKFLNWD